MSKQHVGMGGGDEQQWPLQERWLLVGCGCGVGVVDGRGLGVVGL